MELVKEEIFPAYSKPWIKKFLPKSVVKDIDDTCLAYAIYTEIGREVKPISLVLNWCRDSIDAGFLKSRGTFINHINKYKPRSFKDTLFSLEIYNHPNCPIDLEKASSKFHRPKSSIGRVVECILEESMGILIWHYQLDNILNIFYIDWDEISSIRKGINGKRTETFKMLTKWQIDDSTTLSDLICDRMILGHTKYPNIYGASVLYDLLKHK